MRFVKFGNTIINLDQVQAVVFDSANNAGVTQDCCTIWTGRYTEWFYGRDAHVVRDWFASAADMTVDATPSK